MLQCRRTNTPNYFNHKLILLSRLRITPQVFSLPHSIRVTKSLGKSLHRHHHFESQSTMTDVCPDNGLGVHHDVDSNKCSNPGQSQYSHWTSYCSDPTGKNPACLWRRCTDDNLSVGLTFFRGMSPISTVRITSILFLVP